MSAPDFPPSLLIVDDTAENLDILTGLLGDYRLFVSLEGPGALALAETHLPDLILLDIMMPGMDGFEVCRRLKADEKTKDIPVIFITALNETESLEQAFALGGVDYVTKPFRPAELLARVRTHLQLFAMQSDLRATVEREIAIRQRQERMLQRQARLAAMGEMLDAVAHQWNQPLSVIALQNDLLSLHEGPVPAQTVQSCCSAIGEQVAHMQETLYGFRKFLRPEAKVERIGTLSLVENVQTLLRGPLGNAHVVLQVADMTPDMRLKVNATEFIHVFINLIANAVDAFGSRREQEERTIRIAQSFEPSATILTVEDNAGGIPEAILPTIFEAEVSTKAPQHGSGIGLYMTRRIVEKHGGTIRAENSADGARFTIRLPVG